MQLLHDLSPGVPLLDESHAAERFGAGDGGGWSSQQDGPVLSPPARGVELQHDEAEGSTAPGHVGSGVGFGGEPTDDITGTLPQHVQPHADQVHEPTGLFVANLPQASPDAVLRQALHYHFSRFGLVSSVKVKRERDVRAVSPRKKDGDVWGWVWFDTAEQATLALTQAQGIRVLGRTLRVERAKAHRILLLEPADGVAFVKTESGGWSMVSQADERDLVELLEAHGPVQAVEERRNGAGVLFKFNGSSCAAMLKRLEVYPQFTASLYNDGHPPFNSPQRPANHGLPRRPPPPSSPPQDSNSLIGPTSPQRGRSRVKRMVDGAWGGCVPDDDGQRDERRLNHVDLPHLAKPRSAPSSPPTSALRLNIPGAPQQAPAMAYPPLSFQQQSHEVEAGPAPPQMVLLDDCAIFIGGLDKHMVNDDLLARRFGKYGRVEHLHVVRDAPSSSTAFAFLTFDNPESALRAVEGEHATMLHGQALRVQLREIKPKHPLHLRRVSPVRGLPEFIEASHPRRSPSHTQAGLHLFNNALPSLVPAPYHFPPTPMTSTPFGSSYFGSSYFGSPAQQQAPPLQSPVLGGEWISGVPAAEGHSAPQVGPVDGRSAPQWNAMSPFPLSHPPLMQPYPQFSPGWASEASPIEPTVGFSGLSLSSPSSSEKHPALQQDGAFTQGTDAPWPAYFTTFPSGQVPSPGGVWIPFQPPSPQAQRVGQGALVIPLSTEGAQATADAPAFNPTLPFHLRVPPVAAQPFGHLQPPPIPSYWQVPPPGPRPHWAAGTPAPPPPPSNYTVNPSSAHLNPSSFPLGPTPRPFVRPPPPHLAGPAPWFQQQQPSTFPTTTPRPPFQYQAASRSH